MNLHCDADFPIANVRACSHYDGGTGVRQFQNGHQTPKMAAGIPKMAAGTPKMATRTLKMAADTPKMAAGTRENIGER